MGGDGLALPAGTWSLMKPDIFFMTFRLSGLFDLGEIELDRRRAAKNRNVNANLLLLCLHLDDGAGEVCERPINDPDRLALLEGDARLGTRGPFRHGDVDVLNLRLLDRLRVRAAEEPRDLRGVLDQVERRLVEIHLHEHVAGEELPRR